MVDRARGRDLPRGPSGKIDLGAIMRWESVRRDQHAEEERRNRVLACEVCGRATRAHECRRVALPICWACSRGGFQFALKTGLFFGFSGDSETDAALDDLAAVAGLLWRETRGKILA